MKENTSPGWQQAASATEVWLLDPVPEEAARAYARLLEQLARRLAKYLHFRLDDRLVAELLAEQALERTAEYIYGSLSKPLSHDENTSGIVNEVPPVASPEEYERARKSIQPMAFLFGVNLSVGVVKEVRQPKYLDEDDLHHYVATASLTSTTGDERLNRIRRVLKNLNPTDRHIIKKYYAFADEKNRRSREQLANKLGVSVEALNRRAVRIRRRIDAELSDEK